MTSQVIETLSLKTERQLVYLLRRWVAKCEAIAVKGEASGSLWFGNEEKAALEHRAVIREELLIRWYNRGLIADWTEGVSSDESDQEWFQAFAASDDWDSTLHELGDGLWC
jgi:hypothetical protein